jgi:hypothetical protein
MDSDIYILEFIIKQKRLFGFLKIQVNLINILKVVRSIRQSNASFYFTLKIIL